MHILQPKHSKLNEKDSVELLDKLNISKSQIPKILSNDPALPEGCEVGDIIKIDRKPQASIDSSSNPNEGKTPEGKSFSYYRVVV